LFYVSQELNYRIKDGETLVFSGDSLITTLYISQDIGNGFHAVVDPNSLTMSFKGAKLIVSNRDCYHSFAKSISVSSNGMFLSIDYFFGLTEVFRVRYNGDAPSSISRLCDFSWNATPQSVVDGNAFICATAVENRLILWHAVTGHLVHVIDMVSNISAIDCDEEINAVWVACGTSVHVYSVRNHLIASVDIKGAVSTIKAIKRPQYLMERAAVCGCVNGSILVFLLRVDSKEIRVENLASRHRARIDRVLIDKRKRTFVSIDAVGRTFLWTKVGLLWQCPNVQGICAGCAVCGDVAIGQCPSCSRGICKGCQLGSVCLLCAGLAAF
jgi:hypothetical protein